MANLVLSIGEIGNFSACIAGGLHALGSFGQASHGPCDRARKRQRQGNLDNGRDQGDALYAPALLGHYRVNVARRCGQQNCTDYSMEPLHRHRH